MLCIKVCRLQLIIMKAGIYLSRSTRKKTKFNIRRMRTIKQNKKDQPPRDTFLISMGLNTSALIYSRGSPAPADRHVLQRCFYSTAPYVYGGVLPQLAATSRRVPPMQTLGRLMHFEV